MTIVYENPWFSVIKDGSLHYIQEKGSSNGAVVLAKSESNFVFVAVHRQAHREVLIEAPRGYGEEGETARQCASREMEEETGFRVDESKFIELGTVRPNSAILASSVTAFFVDLTSVLPVSSPDSEIENIVMVPERDIASAIRSGRITDGFTLSALALYWSSGI